MYAQADLGLTAAAGLTPDQVKPPPSVLLMQDAEKHEKLAYEALAAGKVAFVVLAGGEGTRLGWDGPKGTYPLQVGDEGEAPMALFALFADKLRGLERDVHAVTGTSVPIPWYVQTSGSTDAATRAFFAAHDDFGLPAGQVRFLTQGALPCLAGTQDGEPPQLLLANHGSLALAPNGNGGLLLALRDEGVLATMRSEGIDWLHVGSVDNALCQPCNPNFVGHCMARNVECGNLCVKKTEPTERVGIHCLVDGVSRIVEYTVFPKALCDMRVAGPDSDLVYGMASICNHIVSTKFLEEFLQQETDKKAQLPIHMAHKAVPYYDVETQAMVRPAAPNAFKMELFMIDILLFASNVLVVYGDRKDLFSPIKNKPGPGVKDSPETANKDLRQRWGRWLGKKDGEEAYVSFATAYRGGAVAKRSGVL